MQNPEIDQSSGSFSLEQYLGLLWHWAWLIILATVWAASVAYVASNIVTPVYEASTTVLVNESPLNKTLDYSSLMVSSQLTQTYSKMMVKTPILDEVASRLGISAIDPNNVAALPATNTQLINLTVESTDPVLAANIANMIVTVFSEKIEQLQAERYAASEESLQAQIAAAEKQIQEANAQFLAATNQAQKDLLTIKITNYQLNYNNLLQSLQSVRLAKAETISSVVQIEPATPAERPIRPKKLQNTAIAGAVGLLLSAGLVYLFGMFDDTLRTPEEVTRKLGLPILGMIPRFKSNGAPITEEQPRSPVSEAFRTLRTNIQFAGAGIGKPVRAILVTSTIASEGKSTVLVNLSIVMAQNGVKVTILDADLRRPTIHTLLNLPNTVGLSQAFFEDLPSLGSLYQRVLEENILVITSGKLPPNPSELLGSAKMGNILDTLKADSRLILIDTPPALAVTDAVVMVPYVDGVVLVMKLGKTHFTPARQLISQLRRAGANILGIILNEVDMTRSRSRYYYYAHSEDGNSDTGRKKQTILHTIAQKLNWRPRE